MKNSQANYDQSVFINGKKLKGVVSVDGSYTHSYKPLNVLGQGVVRTILADVSQADFSISRNVNFKDIFNPTDVYSTIDAVNSSIRGSLNYGNKVFGFETGYMSSYSYSVSYGDFPQSNIGIKAYGDIGSGLYISNYDSTSIQKGQIGTLNATGDFFDSPDYPIYPSNIILQCRNSSTNRIKDFSYSTNISYNEVYGIGSFAPLIYPKYPLEIQVDFTMEVDDYETKRMRDALVTGAVDSFSINIYGTNYLDIPLYGITMQAGNLVVTELQAGDGTELLLQKRGTSQLKLFNFDSVNGNTRLISEQISATADDVTNVKLSYLTYINPPSGSFSSFRPESQTTLVRVVGFEENLV